ncbi:hypothetical protein BVRB_2g032590 [Beta vulgaris subsp. vulgaris]|nr:hypothetical protein BVRB_2g032590 [Beta vulgaris subsp. vulgaris]
MVEIEQNAGNQGDQKLENSFTGISFNVVKFLLKSNSMGRNAINTNGSTAMDVFSRSGKHVNDKEI